MNTWNESVNLRARFSTLCIIRKVISFFFPKAYWHARALRPLPIMSLLKSCIRGKVLDAGCGKGRHLIFTKNALGVDIDGEELQKLRERGFQVIHLNLDKFPYPFKIRNLIPSFVLTLSSIFNGRLGC